METTTYAIVATHPLDPEDNIIVRIHADDDETASEMAAELSCSAEVLDVYWPTEHTHPSDPEASRPGIYPIRFRFENAYHLTAINAESKAEACDLLDHLFDEGALYGCQITS